MRKHHPLAAFIGGLVLLTLSALAWPIPPNTTITNTASATFAVGGLPYSVSDSETLVTGAGSGNSGPSGVVLAPGAVDENLQDVSVGNLVAVDSDPADSHTFATADPRFVVVGTELRLAPGVSFDFEAITSTTVAVTVTDQLGASLTRDVLVTIRDVNEVPTDILAASNAFAADVPGAILGDLTTVDPDAGDSHTYTVDDTRFEVVNDQLQLVDGESLPPGTSVTLLVTTTDSGGLSYTEPFTVTAAGAVGDAEDRSTARFHRFAPDAAVGPAVTIATTTCEAGAGFADVDALQALDGTPIAIPATVPLAPTAMFKSGSPVFMRVADADANADPNVVDWLEVTVASASGDSEQLRFAETASDSGIFLGYLQSRAGAPGVGNCQLDTAADDTLTLRYVDPADPSDTSSDSARIDPLGRVFYSATGQPISGAVITLVDAAGQPAAVLADNAVDEFPASVTSGGVVSDAGGGRYAFADGTYRYPVVPAGDYRLQVAPPNRFVFPTALADGDLQSLPGAPFSLGAGARGAAFSVAGASVFVQDIPLDLAPLERTPSTLELSALSPGNPAALGRNVQATACWDGNGFVPSGDAADPLAGAVALPQTLPLVDANRYSSGDAVYVQLTDGDQDVDPFARDRVIVDVAVPGQADLERIRLTETGASTGVFSGYLQTGATAAQSNDCQLQADPGSTLEFAYVDAADASDTALATAVLDPGFSIFSSLTGAPVDGVSVTLVDVATGAPADGSVYAADGSTAFPATVVSGGSATDAAGARVDFAAGTVRFPVIAPGTYRLELAPPVGITFPSSVSDADLNVLPTGPYLLVPGSRGGDFMVQPGVVSGFDIPVDPILADVFLSKQASKEVAAVGDFVQYQVQVQSAEGSGAIAAVAVTDTLPKGFRYVPGSARLDGAVLVDPQISGNGRGLVFADLELVSGASLTLSYVTEITAGAELGRARNSATAGGSGIAEVNVAYADVVVREDLLTDKAIVVGRVIDGACNALHDASGLDGVRVFLEDGRYVVTDAEGKFHFEGVDPGTHVVQLDSSSLPGSHELVQCDAGTRFAGSSYSQFVDVQGGSLWRADFYVRPKPDKVTEFSARLSATAAGERVTYRYELSGGDLPITDVKAVVMLPQQLDYVPGSAQLDGVAIADPKGAAERALQFTLPDSTGPVQARIEFAAVASAGGEIATKAIAMFRSEAGAHRTPVAATAMTVALTQRTMALADARVHFAEARSALTAAEREKIAALGRKMKDQAVSDLFVHVIGHADSKPLSRETQKMFPDNDALSLRRAQGVANMLATELGLPAERIRVASHGATEPIADNATEAGRARNRRVEVAVMGGVAEPSQGARSADSGAEMLAVRTSQAIADPAPYTIPPVDGGKPPQFDRAWLANAPVAQAIAWPLDDFNPSIPSTWVAVTHEPHLQAQLMVNDSLANPITFFGTVADRQRGIAVSIWENVGIREGDSELRVHLLDDTGASVSVLRRNVHFGGRPIRAELVPERSHLVADGITPPVLAVRFFDREGYPGRPGLTGEFSVAGSFQAYNLTRDLDLLDNSSTQGFQRYQVREDGIAFIRLEPTTQTGEVQLRFEFDEHRIAEVRARLRPGARDWILLGLAEGTVGYNTVSGNLQSLEEAGLADEVLADGRLAFYAKGQIKGEWLLTAAFDTDKEVQDRLRQQIDPNRFYTLYGDGTEQRFDAESRRKLYLKVEGAQFAALFGDFDTGWDRSEFTRYSRRMNGLQSNYYGTRWELSAFASETELGFYRDELRGDGTSGTYRLSQRNLVANSERVRIVTRDRFRTEQVVEEVLLVRYVDYSIDYDAGSLIFKQPVFGQDQNFNPVFVEVEYEVGNEGGSKELVAGTRIAYQLDDQDSEVALTYIDDNTAGQAGALLGVDMRWDVTPSTRVNAEVAQTDRKAQGTGDAYLLEVEHQSARLAGRAYYREQDGNFGIGQQVGLEQGSRKVGAEGEYQLSDQLRLRADAFQQTETSTGNQRLVVSSLGEYRLGNTRLAGGVRSIREEVADGERRDAEQVTLGLARNFLNNRLALRGDAELDVTGGGANADYPSRAVVGAEYRLSHRLSLIGEQEFGFGERDTQDTRVGVKARPWQGADINTTLQRERGENAERVFATTGLLQQLQLNERWSVDFGVDRVKTLKQDGERPAAEEFLFNPGLPPALGSFDDDFTAFYTGFGYRRAQWDVSSRIELHQGDKADKWNYLLGASHQLADGKVMSGSVALLTEETIEGNVRDQGEARWGVAWRPAGESLLFLNRLDLVFAKNKGDGFDTRTHKLINNFNANFRPDLKNQVSLQLGLKYVVEDIDGEQYDGLTGLLGLEYRRSMGARWDLGLRAASLHSFASKVSELSAGLSVGRNLFKNAWASLGYNFVGFSDRDFMAADYTAQGPYLKLRVKLDQDLLKRFMSFAGWRDQPAAAEKFGPR